MHHLLLIFEKLPGMRALAAKRLLTKYLMAASKQESGGGKPHETQSMELGSDFKVQFFAKFVPNLVLEQ